MRKVIYADEIKEATSGAGVTIHGFTSGLTTEQSATFLSLTPRTAVAFVPATGIQLDRVGGTIYTRYTQVGVLPITLAAGGVSKGNSILEFVASGDAVTFPVGSIADPKGDDIDIVAGHVNSIYFNQVNTIVYYTITNLS